MARSKAPTDALLLQSSLRLLGQSSMVGVVFYLRSLLGHLVRIRRWICNLTSTILTTALVENKCSMRATMAHAELTFRDLALPCDLPAAPTGVCVHALSKDFPRASSMTLYNWLLSASPVCSMLTCGTSTLLKYKSHSASDSPTLILAGLCSTRLDPTWS